MKIVTQKLSHFLKTVPPCQREMIVHMLECNQTDTENAIVGFHPDYRDSVYVIACSVRRSVDKVAIFPIGTDWFNMYPSRQCLQYTSSSRHALCGDTPDLEVVVAVKRTVRSLLRLHKLPE